MCEYVDLTDDPCPKCGNMLVSKTCKDCGGDGITGPWELYELDPWYDRAITEMPNAEALDILMVQECGWDAVEKDSSMESQR
jgi:hypothetical protein